jgi:hypothetical protein
MSFFFHFETSPLTASLTQTLLNTLNARIVFLQMDLESDSGGVGLYPHFALNTFFSHHHSFCFAAMDSPNARVPCAHDNNL